MTLGEYRSLVEDAGLMTKQVTRRELRVAFAESAPFAEDEHGTSHTRLSFVEFLEALARLALFRDTFARLEEEKRHAYVVEGGLSAAQALRTGGDGEVDLDAPPPALCPSVLVAASTPASQPGAYASLAARPAFQASVARLRFLLADRGELVWKALLPASRAHATRRWGSEGSDLFDPNKAVCRQSLPATSAEQEVMVRDDLAQSLAGYLRPVVDAVAAVGRAVANGRAREGLAAEDDVGKVEAEEEEEDEAAAAAAAAAEQARAQEAAAENAQEAAASEEGRVLLAPLLSAGGGVDTLGKALLAAAGTERARRLVRLARRSAAARRAARGGASGKEDEEVEGGEEEEEGSPQPGTSAHAQ